MKRLKNILGDVGYVLETIIMTAFYLSLVWLFCVKNWKDEPPVIIEDDEYRVDPSYFEGMEYGIIHEPQYININTANSTELQQLEGIGEKKAKAIIKYREKYGEFTNIEQITEINGINEDLFENIRDKITI